MVDLVRLIFLVTRTFLGLSESHSLNLFLIEQSDCIGFLYGFCVIEGFTVGFTEMSGVIVVTSQSEYK